MSDEEVAQEHKRCLFMERLREKTVYNKSDPISEWEEISSHSSDDLDDREKRCICSTPIRYVYKIKNKVSGEILEIGSECILRWFGAKKCQNCDSVLGCITKRRHQNKNGDVYAFWCPTCVRNRKKTYGDYKIYKRKFSDIIEDENEVNWFLANTEYHYNYTKFREYVSLYYTITFVEVEV